MGNRTITIAILVVCVCGAAFGSGKQEPAASQTAHTLVYYSREWIPTAIASIDATVAKFKQDRPNVTVERIKGSTGGSREFLITAAASGTMPDVFDGHVRFAVEFGTAGYFLDLKPHIDKDFMPVAVEGSAWKGAIYMFPHTIEPHVFYYNVPALRGAGISPASPGKWWSWNDTMQASRKLTADKNGDGKLDQWGLAIDANVGDAIFKYHSSFFFSAGDKLFYEKDGDWQFDLGPKAVETLQWFQDMFKNGGMWPDCVAGGSQGAFLKGTAAMFMTGSYPRSLDEFKAKKWGTEWGLMPLPVHTETNISIPGTMGVAVGAKSKHPESALALAKALTSAPNLVEWNKGGAWIPARFTAADDPYFRQDADGWSIIRTLSMDYKYFRNIPSHPIISRWYQEAALPQMQRIALGKATPQEAAAEMKKKGNVLVQEYRVLGR